MFNLIFSTDIRAEFHKMLFRIANREDFNYSGFRSSLIWGFSVCLGLFGKQQMFEILEHLG